MSLPSVSDFMRAFSLKGIKKALAVWWKEVNISFSLKLPYDLFDTEWTSIVINLQQQFSQKRKTFCQSKL
jgi:hypothetical protein